MIKKNRWIFFFKMDLWAENSGSFPNFEPPKWFWGPQKIHLRVYDINICKTTFEHWWFPDVTYPGCNLFNRQLYAFISNLSKSLCFLTCSFPNKIPQANLHHISGVNTWPPVAALPQDQPLQLLHALNCWFALVLGGSSQIVSGY